MRGEYESFEEEIEYESFEAYFDYLKEKMMKIIDGLHRLLEEGD